MDSHFHMGNALPSAVLNVPEEGTRHTARGDSPHPWDPPSFRGVLTPECTGSRGSPRKVLRCQEILTIARHLTMYTDLRDDEGGANSTNGSWYVTVNRTSTTEVYSDTEF
ncbi:neuroblastoma suppressor of tumorigenicity 1 [Platysternon megacephalum]|uniref:Neuroblastoma suppressor of tumorigenicity 1 n=1 Tax=Platysternon megacephalum TaxID=55544 RepID=A0A4D9F854_9SAUR|nr:neuroblastoma suppressor of tumorigenicity 1 [Platysternon megacephalum]